MSPYKSWYHTIVIREEKILKMKFPLLRKKKANLDEKETKESEVLT